MKPFYATESFWLTLGAAAAGICSTFGFGHLGAEVKAAIDLGSTVVVAAYVHGVTGSAKDGPASPAAQGNGAPSPALQAAQVADVLSKAADSLRTVQ